jgi:hypothetical protein
MHGGNLAFHLKRINRFQQDQVQFYSAQIICAILFLHEKNFSNLNINLKSILLDSNGNCKLMDDLSCFLTINATHDNKYENDYKDLGDLILQMLIGNTSQNIELSSEANSIIDDLTNKKKYENIKRQLFFNSLDWIKLENGQLNRPLKPDLNSFNFEKK